MAWVEPADGGGGISRRLGDSLSAGRKHLSMALNRTPGPPERRT